MGKPVVVLNIRGINQIMTSPKVQDLVSERAARIAREAGEGFEVFVKPHYRTAGALIRPSSGEGARREARNKVLTRAAAAAVSRGDMKLKKPRGS